jgi:hypothetical protein
VNDPQNEHGGVVTRNKRESPIAHLMQYAVGDPLTIQAEPFPVVGALKFTKQGHFFGRKRIVWLHGVRSGYV